MGQLIKRWFSVAFVLLGLISCRKDALVEPQVPSLVQEDSVTLLLSAEIGFEEDEGDLKGLTFKLEDAGNGRPIPRPQLADGEEVEVHTLIRSSDGIVGAKTLKWRYDGAKKRLVLKVSTDPGQNISVPKFNNDSGRTWLMAALLAPGTTLEGTKVSIQGNRNLRFVRGDIGDDLGDLNVPYWADWVEVKVHSAGARDGDDSYREGYVPSSDFKFKPLGSIIVIRLSNQIPDNTRAGAALNKEDLTMDFAREFTIETELFYDKVRFHLGIPTTNNHGIPLNDLNNSGYLDKIYSMNYRCDAPSQIVNFNVPQMPPFDVGAGKFLVYYAWVMPVNAPSITPKIHEVWLTANVKGKIPKLSENVTNYLAEARARQDSVQLKNGKIHGLSLVIHQPIVIPLDFVAEYNFAGNVSSHHHALCDNYQPIEGTQESHRWSYYKTLYPRELNPYPHRNDQSGYYSKDEINFSFLMGSYPGYKIPTPEQMYGAIGLVSRGPTVATEVISLADNYWLSPVIRKDCTVGSEYSGAFDRHTSEGLVTEVYAIRLKPSTGSHSGYSALRNNSMKCAYRYTYVGGMDMYNRKLTDHLRIDAIYLGNADFKQEGKTELETISDPEWWDSDYRQAGLSYRTSRIFPLAGIFEASSGTGYGGYIYGNRVGLNHQGSYAVRNLNGEVLKVDIGTPYGFYPSWFHDEHRVLVRPFRMNPFKKEISD